MPDAIIRHRLDTQSDRVREHTAQLVNMQITRAIQSSVERCIREGRDSIVTRLAELEREWDIDRVLMANFAAVGGVAYAIGLERYTHPSLFGKRDKGLLYFFGAQIGFLLMHSVVGWCPPVALWRRLGYRTKGEIEVERSALRAALEAERLDHLHTEPLRQPIQPQVAS